MLDEFPPMIVAGTGSLIYIDLGSDEPGMILQRLDGGVWGGLCVCKATNDHIMIQLKTGKP